MTQRSDAKSGDAVAGGQVIGIVGGSATVQAQNSSSGAEAISGDAFAENVLDIGAGPGSGGGQAQQIGDNRVRVVQESSAQSGDAVAGSQVAGFVGSDAVVQLQGSSEDALAISGDAEAVNELVLEAGPFAEGFDSASTSQVGDNDATLSQSSDARSGDAVAGGQVVGSVGGAATVQNQNSSTDPEAESGSAFAENFLEAVAAPSAGIGDPSAQSAQNGDNDIDVDQEARSASGDAVAGSQVTGLVSEERGHLAVLNQQSSDAPIAITGDASSTNELLATAGSDVESDGDVAQASQNGDNEVDVVQETEAVTGDAVAGSQVTGAVGGSSGVVMNQNTSFDAEAITGDAEAESLVEANAGIVAAAFDGTGQASQNGDNEVNVAQRTISESGDAVAGGQVTGLVGGDSTVQASNFADAPLAESGSAFSTAEVIAEAGPSAFGDGLDAQASQNGDNETNVGQETSAVTGDAVSGSGVFGMVDDPTVLQAQNSSLDAEAISGDAEVENVAEATSGVSAEAIDGVAQASQFGDNETSLAQDAFGASGDAVAGSHVLGVVGGGDATAQLQNTSDGSLAESGAAFVINDALLASGPVALADGDDAQASQVGDNDLSFVQDIEASTGDAVAGGQVAGLVDVRDATVQGQNDSDGDFAASADAEGENVVEGTLGPLAEALDAVASSAQNGDNDFDGDQDLDIGSGDAVSGGQVFGKVA